MRTPLPTTKQCKTPNCRAWSWELAAGKPCPYCRKVDRVVKFWIWVNRVVVVASLAFLAGLYFLLGAI